MVQGSRVGHPWPATSTACEIRLSTIPRSACSVDVDPPVERNHLPEPADVLVAQTDASVRRCGADRRLVPRAVEENAVARIERVIAQLSLDAAIPGSDGRNEQRSVEDDLLVGRQEEEFAGLPVHNA